MENNHLYESTIEPEGIYCSSYCSTNYCGQGGLWAMRYKTCTEMETGQKTYYYYCDC